MSRGTRRILAVAALAIWSGCGTDAPEAGHLLTGRVIYREKPLAKGAVVFAGTGNSLQFATIAPDGGYEIRLPAGRYRVGVSSAPAMPEGMSPTDEFAYVSKEPPAIPTKYNDCQSSGLSVQVEPQDGNVQDVVLR